jgi:ligand-binding sensor domain-containing protein
MSELEELQFRFTHMVADLITYAEAQGYTLTFGDAYRDPRVTYGHQHSLHKQRLAIDFNLFVDGVYQKDSEAHELLGLYWESQGGTWGGRWGDANHYSLAYGGMK